MSAVSACLLGDRHKAAKNFIYIDIDRHTMLHSLGIQFENESPKKSKAKKNKRETERTRETQCIRKRQSIRRRTHTQSEQNDQTNKI